MLSKRQQAILRFFYEYNQSNGIFPTIREVCAGTNTGSTSVVKYNLSQLTQQGYIRHSPRRSRSNTLTAKAYEFLKVTPPGAAWLKADSDLREDQVRQLQLQIERLKLAHQVEIEAYVEERARLVAEIKRLTQIVPT